MTKNAEWKIVLVDDEEDIRDVVSLTLMDSGYTVFAASDGESALKLCEEKRPQIMITDIRMPGLSGLQVLEILKNRLPDIEVIVITAFGEIEFAIKALQLDASDFITKPIQDDALHLALHRATERYTSRKKVADYTKLLENEKAKTTQELMRNIAFQRNLIENSMDGILGCDENDVVVIYNRAMEQILGFSKNEILHEMTFDQFFPTGELEKFKKDIRGEAFGGKDRLFLYETTIIGKAGRKIPVQMSAIPLYEVGIHTGMVCFFRDLREIRKLEHEIEDQSRILHQDKMMALGKLAASVVHEINNPLTGILNYLRLILRILNRETITKDHQAKFRTYIELVESETNRCSQIVSSLLTFSRKSPPAFGKVDINELLHRSIILSRHKLDLNHIKLETRIQPDLPQIEGDFNQLQQCIINLVFNAIDAMPEGGVLTLSAILNKPEKIVNISVKDTGTGIPKENLSRLFEPFFTTKKEGYGVGLGLSTVYGIMERHHGKVQVESPLGQGATFTLQIPA